MDQDSSLVIDLNPLEPDATPYAYTIKTPPKYGTLSPDSDHRRWIYTPLRNYYGQDGFEFEATDGKKTKSAKAAITVNDIFIAGRPMTVKFLELTSPAPGEMQAVWFNSYDIDGDVESIRYHVYLSTDKDFYPSNETWVETLQGAVTTTLSGLVENQTYYIAILAEDEDGKLSKRIDKREVNLIASRLVFRDDVQVMTVADLPLAAVRLEEDEVFLTFSTPVQDMTGAILQLDEANDYAFLRLESAVFLSPDAHHYRFSFAQPQEFIQDLAFTLTQGTYDPANALIEYYQDTAGSLDALMAGRSGMASMALVSTTSGSYLSELLNVLLSEWTGFQNVDELYDFLVKGTTINIKEYESERKPCGSGTLSPTFESIDPLGWKPSSLEFGVTLKFECSISYTVKVLWNDLLRNAPELLSFEAGGDVAVDFDATGRISQSFNLAAVSIPRNLQLVKTSTIKLWRFPIPYTVALNVKGTLQGEGFGELTGSFGTVVTAGVKAGVQYSSSDGFKTLENSNKFYSNNLDAPNDTKELVSRIDLSSKVGAKLKARVGPELILSLINAAPAYRRGFNGVASFSTHVGPALEYQIETDENPDIVVQNLGAPSFGISTYEWTGSVGGDSKLAWHIPAKMMEQEFSLDPFKIKFLHYADYDIHYQDGPVGSREFEVAAASSDYWQWNDAKLMQGATRWHVIEPGDAVLNQNRADPLQANGRWSNQYNGDSIIVLEYTPDTLASMVLGLSEATRPVAKQYKLLMPKFLLEGEWNYEYTRFKYDALKFLTGIPKNIYEMMSKGSLENDTFIVNMPPCDMYGSPAFSGSSQFLYNAVQKNYWVETTVLDSKLKMYRVGRFAISELVHSADEILAVFSLDLECVPALSDSLPITSPAERLSNTKVERMMTSEELGKVFSPKAGAPDGGATSGMTALANSMVMSGAIQMKTKVDLKGPDEFVVNAQAIHGTETLFDFEILYKRKNRQVD